MAPMAPGYATAKGTDIFLYRLANTDEWFLFISSTYVLMETVMIPFCITTITQLMKKSNQSEVGAAVYSSTRYRTA